MSAYNLNATLGNIRTLSVMFVDIFIMWLVLYYAIKIVKSNSRTIQIFKGMLLVLLIDGVAKIFGLKTLQYFADIFVNFGFLAIIIIFQPEIRYLLEKLGKTNLFSRISTLTGNEKENLVDQIVKATMLLSQDQTGALISIEQSHSLDDFIMTGTKLNSDVTAELLTSIFVTSTPLHDGAVIIQGDKIACASAYFPPTNLELPSRYGARHRAAIGISEITDAVTIVVSEETGQISIADAGKIIPVERKQLREYLLRVICGEEIEVTIPNQKSKKISVENAISTSSRPESSSAKASLKRQETSVINLLAIKKQEEKISKIEAEAVVSGQDVKSTPEDKKGLFSRFKKQSEKHEQHATIEELESELNEIKLPKKKERPIPSYPTHANPKKFESAAQYDALHNNQEVETPMPAPIVEKPVQTVVQEAEIPAKTEPVAPVQRMSAEEVRAAREKFKQQFSGNRQEVIEENRYEAPLTMNRVIRDEESKQFDTSKIDISKIMGFNDDLNQTLEMVDHLETESTKNRSEGGDR